MNINFKLFSNSLSFEESNYMSLSRLWEYRSEQFRRGMYRSSIRKSSPIYPYTFTTSYNIITINRYSIAFHNYRHTHISMKKL